MTSDSQFGSSFGGSSTSTENNPEEKTEVDSNREVDSMFDPTSSVEEQNNDSGLNEEVVDTEIEAEEYEPDVPNDASPNGGEFKWDDIRKALEFQRLFLESNKESRAWFRWILNMSDDTSVTYILKRLRYFDGTLWSLEYSSNLINVLSSGSNNMMETLRIGAELANLETENRRSLFGAIERLANSFKANPESDDVVLRYRKNMDDNTFMNIVIETISSIDPVEANKNLEWAFKMINIWKY